MAGCRFSHVTGLSRDRLHWLPVAQRIRFKLCLTMYKAMHGLAPAYLSELCASSCVLKVEFGRLLAATLQFSGREQSSADVHSSSQVRRHGPVAVLRSQLSVLGQFQDGAEDIFLHC